MGWLVGVAGPYQTEGDTAELHHVGVCDAVEAAHPGVEHRDQGGDDDGRVEGDHQDDRQRGA